MPLGKTVESKDGSLCTCRKDKKTFTLKALCHVPFKLEPPAIQEVEKEEQDPERKLRRLNTRPRQLLPILARAAMVRSRR